jgi:four helix bundle protein
MGNVTSKPAVKIISRAEEASRARSAAEFCSKIDGALQEADESQLWIELLREDCGIDGDNIAKLHSETNELIAMFVTMANKTQRKNSPPL